MYLSFYQLKEPPFRLTPDPRFLHLAEPHRVVLTSLVEGVLLRKGIIVATGPIGTGKTTLLHAALQLLSGPAIAKSLISSAFILNPVLTRDELLEAILEEFNITSTGPSKPRRLMALHQMLLETQYRGGTAVLIIDEAHLLTPSCSRKCVCSITPTPITKNCSKLFSAASRNCSRCSRARK